MRRKTGHPRRSWPGSFIERAAAESGLAQDAEKVARHAAVGEQAGHRRHRNEERPRSELAQGPRRVLVVVGNRRQEISGEPMR